MALPTVEKSWNVNLNHQFGGVSDQDDHKQGLLHFVTTVLGWANNPWTLIGSCDSLTAGYPGPGWTAKTDIVATYTSAVHSWIILEKGDGEGQLLISMDTDSSSTYQDRCCYWAWDPKGAWTGGTTTTRPTSATGQTMCTGLANVFWLGGSWSGKQTYTVHARHSQDGKQDYWFWGQMGNVVQAMFFVTPEDYPSAWNNPGMAAMHPDTTTGDVSTLTTFYSTQYFKGVGNDDEDFQASMIVPAYDGSTILSALSDIGVFETGDEYKMARIEVGTNHGAGFGLLGRLPDIWAGSSDYKPGYTYPANNDRDFAHMGQFIIPWDGSIPQTW